LSESNVIRAFSDDHVMRLTDLSKSQLRYWDKTGFFAPSYSKHHGPHGRVYSFRDVVGLRTIAVLRKHHKVSLQHLRQVAEKLSHLGDAVWAATTLYVLNRKVYFHEPETGKVRGVVSGQYAIIPLVSIMNDISERAERLKGRQSDRIGRVERNRYVAHNAWVIAGTRIPTRAIKSFRDAGYSIEDIQREYPTLTSEDIRAALEHEEKASPSAA
jgi:DNA-binding transcriptional MerR regulator